MNPSPENSLESLFYTEASSRLQSLLEKFAAFKASGEERDAIEHILHTLKGSAGMVGFKEEAQMLHDFEEQFQTLDHSDKKQVLKVEAFLKDIVEMLSPTRRDFDSVENAVPPAPFSLAQKLLASVSRFESLFDSWVTNRGKTRVTKDQQIRAELAFSSELKELRKHSFRLAFGRPADLFFGLEELTQLVARSEGKQVALHCRSEANYVLREYVPELRAALVHLLSNCVVHGLEAPSVREARAKSPQGKIEIDLVQSADKLSLIVCDDGSGVDIAALESRYRKQEFEVDWSELSDEQRLNLLFDRGTSLRDGATLHAGRGVGLSSVRETARRLGGEVAFEMRDLGSCVHLKVPSPFYVIEGLIVESEGHLLSIATASLDSIEEVKERQFPSLSACLNLPPLTQVAPRFVLWVEGSQKKVGVAVEKCIGLKELVVYPSPEVKGMSPALIGLCDSGDSQHLVVELSKLQLRARPRPVKVESPSRRLSRILVVDDSATTRSILVEVLQRAGFEVVEAEDGLEALERMEELPFQAVVSDLEMPRLNGLEFLEKLREPSSPYATLPFLLFTSRDDTQSFQKALLLGADRCMGKAAFNELEFLALLKELIHEN